MQWSIFLKSFHSLCKLFFFYLNDIIGDLAQILNSSFEAEEKKKRISIGKSFLMETIRVVVVFVWVEMLKVSGTEVSSSGPRGIGLSL